MRCGWRNGRLSWGWIIRWKKASRLRWKVTTGPSVIPTASKGRGPLWKNAPLGTWMRNSRRSMRSVSSVDSDPFPLGRGFFRFAKDVLARFGNAVGIDTKSPIGRTKVRSMDKVVDLEAYRQKQWDRFRERAVYWLDPEEYRTYYEEMVSWLLVRSHWYERLLVEEA